MFRFDCTFSNFNCTKRVQLHTILRPGERQHCTRWVELYELRHELVPPLKILFDTSHKLNQLPAEWKYVHITAIIKKGSKSDQSNYRPISLTSVICKLMESLVRDHIMEFFSQNNYFSKNQFGFIKGRSTALQLLCIMDDWTKNLDIDAQVDIIYTDFAKALIRFLDPYRLLNKLKLYNISDKLIAWIQDFLVIGNKAYALMESFLLGLRF